MTGFQSEDNFLIALFALSSLILINNPHELGILLFSFYGANETDKNWRTNPRQHSSKVDDMNSVSLSPELNIF